MRLQVAAKVAEPSDAADAIARYAPLLNEDAMEALGFSLPSVGQFCVTMGARRCFLGLLR